MPTPAVVPNLNKFKQSAARFLAARERVVTERVSPYEVRSVSFGRIRVPCFNSARRRYSIVRRNEIRKEEFLLRRQAADSLVVDLVEDAIHFVAVDFVNRLRVDLLVVRERLFGDTRHGFRA